MIQVVILSSVREILLLMGEGEGAGGLGRVIQDIISLSLVRSTVAPSLFFNFC
jgi:hypothetical protein